MHDFVFRMQWVLRVAILFPLLCCFRYWPRLRSSTTAAWIDFERQKTQKALSLRLIRPNRIKFPLFATTEICKITAARSAGEAFELFRDFRSKVKFEFFPSSFPRAWELLKYLLPHGVRNRLYLPAIHDLMVDHEESKRFYRTRWARRWLRFCFTFRTVLLVGDCWRAIGIGKTLAFIQAVIPEPVRRWWSN